MMMSAKVGWVALLVAAISGGCKKKDNEGEKESGEPSKTGEPSAKVTTGSGTGSAPVTPEVKALPPPAPPKSKGLEDPANDAKVVAAAKQLIADCGAMLDTSTDNSNLPNQKKSYHSCEKWTAFRETDFGDLDATWVNLTDDPDVKVRAIGVFGLGQEHNWRSDKDLAARVVDGLRREKPPSPIDHNWALVVADISSSAGLDETIKGVAMDPATSMDVKLALFGWWRNPLAFDAIKAAAGTTDPAMMNAVVQGYINHFEEHTEEACAYWADHLETPNATANEYAIGHLTGGWGGNTTGDSESEDYISGGGGGPSSSETKRCSAEQLTKVLDLFAKKFAAGDSDSSMGYALAFIVKDKLTPAPVKAKAVELLKQMVEKVGYYPRGRALTSLVETGDPEMKTYAEKFKDDEELKDTVAELMKPKAE